MTSADIPSAPPIVAGELPPKPATWPKVVGIIFIVFGALGIMQGCMGVFSMLMLGTMAGMMPQGEGQQMFESIAAMQPWLVAVAMITFCIAIILLVAGIGVVMRKSWGRTTALGWAMAKMVLVVFSGIVNYMMQKLQFEQMQEMMANDPNAAQTMPMAGSFMTWISIFTIVFTIIWGWILPVFTLIWFSRSKIRSEVVSWGGESLEPSIEPMPRQPLVPIQPETKESDKKYWRSDPSD